LPAPDDEIPPSTVALLAHLLRSYGEQQRRNLLAWGDYLERNGIVAGTLLSEKEDQPRLGDSSPHTVWVAQRALDYWGDLAGDDRSSCEELMQECGGRALLETRLPLHVERRNGKLRAV
jgi:hypothetical protein